MARVMRRMYSLCVLLMMCYMADGLQAQERMPDLRHLPARVRHFLMCHYKKVKVTSVREKAVSWFEKREYIVKLEDGKEIAFDGNGNWKEINGKRSAIPVSLVPGTILQHVGRSFPGTDVVKLRKTAQRYEIALSNGLQLLFDKAGEFVKIKH